MGLLQRMHDALDHDDTSRLPALGLPGSEGGDATADTWAPFAPHPDDRTPLGDTDQLSRVTPPPAESLRL